MNKQKEQSGKTQLYATQQQIQSEISELYEEAKKMNEVKNKLLNELSEMKGDVNSQMKNMNVYKLSDLKKKEAEINEKMMFEKYSALQEKEFQAQLLDIKKKQGSFGELKKKADKTENLEKELGETKGRLKEIYSLIDNRKKEMEELRDEIEDLKKKGAKNDIVIEYEDRIEELRKKKDELNEKKKNVHAEIQIKEEEHEKYLAEIAAQFEIENRRRDQENKVKKLDQELNKFEEERSNFDANKYDGIIDAVKKIQNVKQLPLSIVQVLASEKITPPKSQDDISNIIKTLEEKKLKFSERVGGEISLIDSKISSLVKKIKEEKEILEGMPKSEVRIQKNNKN